MMALSSFDGSPIQLMLYKSALKWIVRSAVVVLLFLLGPTATPEQLQGRQLLLQLLGRPKSLLLQTSLNVLARYSAFVVIRVIARGHQIHQIGPWLDFISSSVVGSSLFPLTSSATSYLGGDRRGHLVGHVILEGGRTRFVGLRFLNLLLDHGVDRLGGIQDGKIDVRNALLRVFRVQWDIVQRRLFGSKGWHDDGWVVWLQMFRGTE